MLRTCLLLLFTCLLLQQSFAQQNLKGHVFEIKTRIALPGIRIQNTRTKLFTETDINGKFSIGAAENDVLILSGFSYQTDTLLLTDLKEREIFLLPKTNMLNEVNIFNQQVNLGGLYDPQFHNQTTVYQRDANGNYKGGVAFRIWSNHKGEKQRAKLAKQQHVEEMRLQIAKVFSAQNLANYLPLKTEELEGFSVRYMPTVKQYEANEFNLLAYINTCYKQFQKLPPEKRLVEKLGN